MFICSVYKRKVSVPHTIDIRQHCLVKKGHTNYAQYLKYIAVLAFTFSKIMHSIHLFQFFCLIL